MSQNNSTRIVGYVVKTSEDGKYVGWADPPDSHVRHSYLTATRPWPISRGAAYRLIGEFLDQNEDWNGSFRVVPIRQTITEFEDDSATDAPLDC